LTELSSESSLPAALGDLDVIRDEPLIAETPERALAHAITPASSVYVRSNFPTPMLDEAHRVRVGGAVAQSFEIGIPELRGLDTRTIIVTMECAGNDRLGMRPVPDGEPWNHGAISTVEWTGVSLRQLLERAGVHTDAVEIVATGADAGERDGHAVQLPFARSLPLSAALHEDTIVAFAMNGTPLTAEHGAPLRLVVPRWYGMASVKWLVSIDAVTTPFNGHFQRERYVYDRKGAVTPVTTMRVKSFIVSPADDARVSKGRITVEGWAWTGTGEVSAVDVSLDGESWHPATIGQAQSRHAWRPWRATVDASTPGQYELRSRATDDSGNVQPVEIEWNRLGYGNNAIRANTIHVV
jgi:DMSO/TMAO reductase YedYZ molybdopterin-dependent catalytic subunit